ncbi:hypothetical protein TZ00_12845 [Agreia bicolorata]|uniref:Major facilitator superfamily (MFS) profile domain-containing protein n=1 Tax=Agreia bicolorata TaxID=110935 RepID=A0ABR5CEI7_9MICO|nr:hypothetical protein TZ00_12845 [Agreia bicolorata]
MPLIQTQSRLSLFWRYWLASSLSGVGLSIASVAFPLVAVVTLGSSPLELGIVAAASNIGWLLLGLPAGVIAERFALKRVQISMDLLRLLVIAAIVAMWATGVLSIWSLVVAGFVVSCADVLFDVANSTYLPSIIDDDELEQRNSLMSATHAVASTGGPALGGVMAGILGPVLTLATTGIGYLASAFIFSGFPSVDAAATGKERTYRSLIGEGVRHVFSHPVLRPTTILAAVLNFAVGAQAALVAVFLVRELDVNVAVVGLLLAFDGVGALIGAAIATTMIRRLGSARTTLQAAWATTAGCILLAVALPGWGLSAFAAGSVLAGAGAVVVSITTRSYRQRETPPELLGRVMATVRFISWGCLPLGSLIAGILAQTTTPKISLVVIGVASAAAPLIFALSAVGRVTDLNDVEP